MPVKGRPIWNLFLDMVKSKHNKLEWFYYGSSEKLPTVCFFPQQINENLLSM